MKIELLPEKQGIYKINFPNGKIYVGLSKNITQIKKLGIGALLGASEATLNYVVEYKGYGEEFSDEDSFIEYFLENEGPAHVLMNALSEQDQLSKENIL